MATPSKTGPKAPKATDSQDQMTNFVQTFSRPAAPVTPPTTPNPAPTAPAPDAEAVETAEFAPASPTLLASEPTPEPENQVTTGKKKATATDENAPWAETYLQPVRRRKTKAIYVDEETHAALTLITQDTDVGLADLLINVMSQHFEAFRPEIRQFLSDQERLKKKKNPFSF